MVGLAFSKAGMAALFSASVCSLLPPLPYEPQNVRVTCLVPEPESPDDEEHAVVRASTARADAMTGRDAISVSVGDGEVQWVMDLRDRRTPWRSMVAAAPRAHVSSGCGRTRRVQSFATVEK